MFRTIKDINNRYSTNLTVHDGCSEKTIVDIFNGKINAKSFYMPSHHKPSPQQTIEDIFGNTDAKTLSPKYYFYFSQYCKYVKRDLNKMLEYAENGYRSMYDPSCFNIIGCYYYNIKLDFVKAIHFFTRTHECGKPCGYANIGIIYENQRNLKKAEKYYQLAIDNGYIEAYNIMSGFHDRQNNLEKALDFRVKGVEKGSSSCACSLGLHYVNINDFENAKKYLQIAIDNEYQDAYIIMARLYEQYGNEEKQIEYLHMGFELGIPDCISDLGAHYESKKNIKKAIFYYKTAAYMDNTYAISNLSQLFFSQKNTKQALKIIDFGIKRKHHTAMVLKGHYFYKNNNYKEALKYYDMAVKFGNEEAYMAIVVHHYEVLNEKESAIDMLDKCASTKFTTHIETRLKLYLNENDIENAEKFIKENNTLACLLCMVRHYETKKDREKEFYYYNEILKLRPNHNMSKVNMAWVRYQQNEFQEAYDRFKNCYPFLLKKHYYKIADCAKQLGKMEEYVLYLKKGFELDDQECTEELGMHYNRKKEYKLSINFFNIHFNSGYTYSAYNIGIMTEHLKLDHTDILKYYLISLFADPISKKTEKYAKIVVYTFLKQHKIDFDKIIEFFQEQSTKHKLVYRKGNKTQHDDICDLFASYIISKVDGITAKDNKILHVFKEDTCVYCESTQPDCSTLNGNSLCAKHHLVTKAKFAVITDKSINDLELYFTTNNVHNIYEYHNIGNLGGNIYYLY